MPSPASGKRKPDRGGERREDDERVERDVEVRRQLRQLSRARAVDDEDDEERGERAAARRRLSKEAAPPTRGRAP